MPKLILISGKKRSGKDTFAGFVKEALAELAPGLSIFHTFFAKALKDGSAEDFSRIEDYLCGISEKLSNLSSSLPEDMGAFAYALTDIATKLKLDFKEYENNKNELQRLFWQIYGTEIFRKRNSENYWTFRALTDCIAAEADITMITDARFINEITDANMFYSTSDIEVVRIQRDLADQISDSHSSETALDDYKFEVVVSNNGTLDELREKAREFAIKIISEDVNNGSEKESNTGDDRNA